MGTHSQSVAMDNCIRTCYTIGFIILLISAVIYFNPSPIDPQPYSLGPLPSVKITDQLNNAEVIFRQRRMLKGPESIAIDSNTNFLYTGTQDGKIIKANLEKPYSSAPQMIGVIGDPSKALPLPCGTYTTEPICGRPLGMKFLNGSLYITDAYFGIFRYDTTRHRLERLASDFIDVYFANGTGDSTGVTFNDVAVANDGTVYFTVSSVKFTLRDLVYDLFEHKPNGIVAKYDPITEKTSIIAQDLYFPNGIVISPDQKYLYFSELSKARILRLPIHPSGSDENDVKTALDQIEVFIDNLPILPDNLAWITPDELWVAGSGPRVDSSKLPDDTSKRLAKSLPYPLFDLGGNYPWARKFLTKLIPASFNSIFLHEQRGGIVRIDVKHCKVLELMVTDPQSGNGNVAGIAHSIASITPHNPGNLPDGQIHVYIGGYRPDVSSIGRLIWDTKTGRVLPSIKQQHREKRRQESRRERSQINE